MFESQLTLSIIIGAALADSINPCVIGVLVFLLIFMTRVFNNRAQMLIGGFFYTAVVYITYLLLGLGILKTIVSFNVASAFYWIAAVIAIFAGIVEIKDFFWYGRGFTLQMIPGAAERLKRYTDKIEFFYTHHPRLALALIGLLGVFVVMVELPCTGAPYFAILALLAKGEYATAVPYLLLYNLIFVIPLFIVIAFSYFGQTERIAEWRLHHRGIMRLGVGLFLIAIGAYMIYSVL